MRRKMLGLYILLGFVMLQYQNCAAPSQDFGETEFEASSPVNSIDEIEVGQLFFPGNQMITSADALNIVGACGQSGSVISWDLRNQSGHLIDRGHSQCDQGSFIVELSDDLINHCGQDLSLSAALGVSAKAQSTLFADCDIM